MRSLGCEGLESHYSVVFCCWYRYLLHPRVVLPALQPDGLGRTQPHRRLYVGEYHTTGLLHHWIITPLDYYTTPLDYYTTGLLHHWIITTPLDYYTTGLLHHWIITNCMNTTSLDYSHMYYDQYGD